ncbi:hypothetical protein EG329_008076 [Mollisiaceae sp. DMI_Dod_QoI]|nr:hypothetical protein EG329_008076 [Helotiales sp. DMI_Dod_QoI]
MKRMPIQTSEIEVEWWGWTLPETRKILVSFDHLAAQLAPENVVRVPGSGVKVPGEIWGRVKTLQTIVRAAIFSPREKYEREVIKVHLDRMKGSLEAFLASEDVRMLLREAGASGENRQSGRADVSVIGMRRRRDVLTGERRQKVLDLIRDLEGDVEVDLKAIEDVVWVRKVIKLGSIPSQVKGTSRLDLVREWVIELCEELYGYALLGWRWIFILAVLAVVILFGLQV